MTVLFALGPGRGTGADGLCHRKTLLGIYRRDTGRTSVRMAAKTENRRIARNLLFFIVTEADLITTNRRDLQQDGFYKEKSNDKAIHPKRSAIIIKLEKCKTIRD